MPLGFDPSNVPGSLPADTNYRQFMASSLQQLGKQVSEGIKQIATNRQIRQMGDELQQLNPNSELFPQEMVGIISRYPLGANDRRGQVALSMMGAQHKNWLDRKTKENWTPVPGGNALFNESSGEFKEVPAGMRTAKKPTVIRGSGGNAIGVDESGKELWRVEDPFPEKAPKPIVKVFPDGSVRTGVPGTTDFKTIAEGPQTKNTLTMIKTLSTARESQNREYNDLVNQGQKLLIESTKEVDSKGNPINFLEKRTKLNAAGVLKTRIIESKEKLDKMDDKLEALKTQLETIMNKKFTDDDSMPEKDPGEEVVVEEEQESEILPQAAPLNYNPATGKFE